MRKNELIALLNNIKGNPEIVMWNGYVEDYQHIGGAEEYTLYKEQKSHIAGWILHDKRRKAGTFDDISLSEDDLALVDKIDKERQWEFPNQFFTEEEVKSVYGNRKKKVVMLNAKRRDKTSFDRIGGVCY